MSGGLAEIKREAKIENEKTAQQLWEKDAAVAKERAREDELAEIKRRLNPENEKGLKVRIEEDKAGTYEEKKVQA